MDNNISVRVRNLTKVYRLYDKPQDRLKEALNPFKKSYHRDFYALQDVSFDIRKGETVGIVGKNGAGKSTLLKMITGVLTPTAGSVQTYGTVASLLELGAGFNPEMTGLENVYLNGTLMGLSKEQIDEKLDAILAFADIGDFIHQPVKMYSSGMFARLAFSVSINVDPDILIVDEALSVGDMAFQMKCFKKFQEFQAQNRTILFVTHALDTVIRYCNRGMVIDGGRLIFDGGAKEAVDTFKKVLTNTYRPPTTETRDVNPVQEGSRKLLRTLYDHKELDSYGNLKAEIYDFGLLDPQGAPLKSLDYGSPFRIVMKVRFNETIEEPIFAFTVKDLKGLEITGTNTMMKHRSTGRYEAGEEVVVTFEQPANLQIGRYALSLGCVAVGEGGIEVYHRLYDAILFEVIGSAQMVGFFDLGSTVTLDRNPKKEE